MARDFCRELFLFLFFLKTGTPLVSHCRLPLPKAARWILLSTSMTLRYTEQQERARCEFRRVGNVTPSERPAGTVTLKRLAVEKATISTVMLVQICVQSFGRITMRDGKYSSDEKSI